MHIHDITCTLSIVAQLLFVFLYNEVQRYPGDSLVQYLHVAVSDPNCFQCLYCTMK